MSEQVGQSNRYWCKYCKLFVRDSKLERRNHDATPRHQGSLKRFLRDLHRGHEQEDREKDRAKSEVARLNGIVSGAGNGESSKPLRSGGDSRPLPTAPFKQPTSSQRKQQLAQLAEMGVSIPEEFRGEMAMAGDWQVTAERVLDPNGQESTIQGVGIGVHKKPVVREENEEETMDSRKRKWGPANRSYRADGADEAELDAVLSQSNLTIIKADPIKSETKKEPNPRVKPEGDALPVDEAVGIKTEATEDDSSTSIAPLAQIASTIYPVQPTDSGTIDVVFKKRKVKNIRHK